MTENNIAGTTEFGAGENVSGLGKETIHVLLAN
jgi:hypothetical protein